MTVRNIIATDTTTLCFIAEAAVNSIVSVPEAARPELLKGIFGNIEQVRTNQLDGVFLLYEKDGDPAGFILVKNYWNLSDLFVFPAHQGLGIGRSLWRAAFAECVKHCDRPAIRVNSSLNAVPFYESFGFQRIESEEKWPEFVVPLELSLDPSSD